MREAIIIGVFTFVGHGLCCHLLEEDTHVIGIDLFPAEDSLEEEKMFRIGRNANFQFEELSNFPSSNSLFGTTDIVIYALDELSNRNEDIITNTLELCYANRKRLILLSLAANPEPLNTFDAKWCEELDLTLNKQIIKYNGIHFFSLLIDFSSIDIHTAGLKVDEFVDWVKTYFHR